MQSDETLTRTFATQNQNESAKENNDYSILLDQLGAKYQSIYYHWQVGSAKDKLVWALHLSVIQNQIETLLLVVVPLLIHENIVFRIVRDTNIASQQLEGQIGNYYVGKIVSIYPESAQHAVDLAKKLLILTSEFKGPAIQNSHRLGNITYTQIENPIIPPDISLEHNFHSINKVSLSWPFDEIAKLKPQRQTKLLDNQFYITEVLKQNPRGDVLKALYFKKAFRISTCVIKQGRKYMLLDNFDRDVQDRLKWQYELSRRLSDIIPLPKPLAFFSENEDTYFAMDFIRGTSVTTAIDNIFLLNSWIDLPPSQQIQLLNHFLEIINIIDRIHQNGFVHRDITPDNFLLDTQGKIWVLDIELMWNLQNAQQFPPFQLGTEGFMSPAQQQSQIPTLEDDIYALGAIAITILTHLPPTKFLGSEKERLVGSLKFLIHDEKMSKTIAQCMATKPEQRPNVNQIRSSIRYFKETLQKKANVAVKTKINIPVADSEEVKETIQDAINGLIDLEMISPDGLWLSNFRELGQTVKPNQNGMTIYLGWHTGLSGPLWLLATAKKYHFNIEKCMPIYINAWQFVFSRHTKSFEKSNSLFSGTAGIALALSTAIESNLLSISDCDQLLEKCFSTMSDVLSLSEGISGQALALLHAGQHMDKNLSPKLLNSMIDTLLRVQSKDGGWNFPNDKGKNDVYSLDKGVPGVIWFLLHFLEKNMENEVLSKSTKALIWLQKSVGQHPEVNSRCRRDVLGITLLWIKAFQVTSDAKYKNLAESILNTLPDRPILINFSLESGLAGLGELYLEAYKAFNNPKWLQRANWIAQIFLHTFQRKSQTSNYWILDQTPNITSDLFVGVSGVIHFLMHFHLPQKINHPLNPHPWQQ